MRLRPPRRGTVIRLGAVLVLLGIAAVLIRSGPPAGRCAAPVATAKTTASTATRSGQPASSGQPAIPAGTVGVPVRLADPTALALVHPGNRVDLLRLDDEGDTTPVASAALVLDVTGADDPATGGLLLALGGDQAAQAVAAPGRGFAILIRPG
ncbi:hypothetical protein ACTOB_008153 [Actinoplanes oblitus]|uniref:Flp pilus assembly protein RcpC/CpaB domain-containing protein n=1 Tax=Actinoplanes oblitus TaxID=3040509 RepID=A0ABY8WF34_9ACTN|nr:hypothetical protein [Actinoplanes oblitus]WIM96002.1 hypothetical protein ACTOB_008153 [Actinoplanes oblitus]